MLFAVGVQGQEISSPSKKIAVQLNTVAGGKIKYSVKANNKEVLVSSALGLVRSDLDFSEGLVLLKVKAIKLHSNSCKWLSIPIKISELKFLKPLFRK